MTRQAPSGNGQPTSTARVQTAHNLPRVVLVEIVAGIQGRMYLELDERGSEFWNPGKQWSCGDVCQDVQDILHRYGLVPGEEQPYEDKVSGAGDDIAQLVEFAETSGIESGDLDELVHECAAATASAINNSGLSGQINFLVEQLGEADVETSLSELAASKSASTSPERPSD
jgi:hypothetical protein